MSLRPLLPWLLLAGALSIAAMVLGAGRGDRFNPALAAGLFAAAVIAAAIWINAPLWRSRAPSPEDSRDVKNALVSNVWLAALVYGWGALALFAVYSLSELVWRHSWQYGLGAALFAVGVSLYAFRLDSAEDRAAPPFALTALHGLAAAGGLAYLIAEGKLATHRGDWAANDVFLAGGIAIILLCLIAGLTQKRAPIEPA
jgi:hypothetical protein